MRTPLIHLEVTNVRGVALAEALVAIFVFVAASSGILGAYLASHHISEYGTDAIRATNDVDDIMERIHATPFTDVLSKFPNGVIDGPVTNNYANIVGGYTLQNEQITVSYPTQAPSRLEILVTVSWVSLGRTRSATFSTLRTSG